MKTVQLQLFLLFLTLNVYTQRPDSILTGTYLTSTPDKWFTLYNYSLVKSLGFNTILQRAVVPISGKQTSNFDSLGYFQNIIALNDSVKDNVFHEPNADWVYYLSNALYSKWVPDQNFIPDLKGDMGLRKLFGTVTSDGVTTGTDTSFTGKLFIDGPNYGQYRKYVYTNKYNSNGLINYTVVFRLKNIQSIGAGEEVCMIQAVIGAGPDSIVLAEKIVTKSMLGEGYTDISMEYDYSQDTLPQGGRGDLPLPPTTIAPGEGVEDSYFRESRRIRFKVIWLGNAELGLKHVEVYDNSIWKYYFIKFKNLRDQKLNEYLSRFSGLQPNLKYFITLDEPNSLDSYYPIKTLQSVLDSLGSQVSLMTHFYPGWDNMRESGNALGSWYKYVKPRRLMYWYFPYGVNTPSENGLYFYGKTLEEAAKLDPHFMATVQTWGFKDNLGNYHDYRSPSPAEVSAQTLYALSYGAKGIFYEPFYSYGSWWGNANSGVSALVEGIVDTNFNPRNIYYKVQELNSRIRGDLGRNLVRMNYSESIRRTTEYGADSSFSNSLDLLPVGTGVKYTFHAGIFTDSTAPTYLNFLLINLHVKEAKEVKTVITNPPGYSNYRYQSLDPAGFLDTTIVRTDTVQLALSAGDGILLRVSPALLEGGTLWISDTVKTTMALKGNLKVSDGKKLVVEDGVDYSINDTLEFTSNSELINAGYINVEEGGAISQTNWSMALFRGRKGNHPFIYWSKNTTVSGLSNYRVYRKNGNSAWELTGSTTGCTYWDTTVTIVVPGHPAGSEEQYKVVPVNQRGVEGSATNSVSYEIKGGLLEKQGKTANRMYSFVVDQNYPNPFNPITRIEYEIPLAGLVAAALYDITGEKVLEILNEEKSAGRHSIAIDGRDLSNGVYFFRLKSGQNESVKKLILLK